MSTYGDTGQLNLIGGRVQPTNTLIDVIQEPAHWLITLAPLRTQQGGRITSPAGAVAFVGQGTVGHAGRESPFAFDWPIQGGTLALCCSSIRLRATFEGSAITTAGAELLDVVFTAWAARQSGPRQTIWSPVRSVSYGNMKAPADPSSKLVLPVPGWARAYTIQVAGSSAAVANGHLEVRHRDQFGLALIRSDEWSVNTLLVAPGVRTGLLEGVIGAAHLAPLRRVMLPPTAESLELENATAVDLNGVRVVYDLDLG